MATAGIDSTIEVSDDDGATYSGVGGADTVNFPRSRVELDATSFSDDAFVRIVGIKDTSCTISGKYDKDDAGQTILESALGDGSDVNVKFLPDGANGYSADFKVQSFDINSSADGVVEFSCNLVGNDTNGWNSATA